MQFNNYISVGQFSDKDGHDESRDGGECIGESHQSSGVIRGDVNVIGEETAIHSGHKHRTEGHEGYGGIAVTTGQTDADKTSGRKERSCAFNKTHVTYISKNNKR